MSPLGPRLSRFTGLAGGHETCIAYPLHRHLDKLRSAEHILMSSKIHQVVARTAWQAEGRFVRAQEIATVDRACTYVNHGALVMPSLSGIDVHMRTQVPRRTAGFTLYVESLPIEARSTICKWQPMPCSLLFTLSLTDRCGPAEQQCRAA